MPRLFSTIIVLACLLTLAACGSAIEATPQPTTPTGTDPTMTSTSTYPKTGHAPDYSWVAGRVTLTKIQGGCIYIYTDPADIQSFETALTPQSSGGGITGPIVSTAEGGSTSPPLRDITPQTGPQPTEPPTSRFVPGGAWEASKYKDGDYVVLLGRLAGPGDTQEICPGGTAYVVDSVIANP